MSEVARDDRAAAAQPGTGPARPADALPRPHPRSCSPAACSRSCSVRSPRTTAACAGWTRSSRSPWSSSASSCGSSCLGCATTSALDIAIVCGALIAGYCTSLIKLQESQFLIGFGLAGLGVFAAYFRPRRRLVVLLLVMTGSYTVGVAINPLLPTPTSYIVAVLMIWGMAHHGLDARRAAARAGDVRQPDRDAEPARPRRRRVVGGRERRAVRADDHASHCSTSTASRPTTTRTATSPATSSSPSSAGAWVHELRAGDILARYGGDEFALVLPFSSRDEAADVVRRLRRAHPASWSVGFADWAPGESLYDALKRADAGLYSDKGGRGPPVASVIDRSVDRGHQRRVVARGPAHRAATAGCPCAGSPVASARAPRSRAPPRRRARACVPFVAAVAPARVDSKPARASTSPVRLSHAALMSPSTTTVPASCSSHHATSSRACVVPCRCR